MKILRTRKRQESRSLQKYLILSLLTSALVCGCVSHRLVVSPETRNQMLPFVETHRTTRDDLVRNMGEPSRVFVDSKVWIYFLGLNVFHDGNENKIVVCRDSKPEGGEILVETSTEENCTLFHLVVSFNHENIIERQTVVKVR
jgi:hypothetical protein